MPPHFTRLDPRIRREVVGAGRLTVRRLMAIIAVFGLALGAGIRLGRDESPRGVQWRAWIADMERWAERSRARAATARRAGDRRGEAVWAERARWFEMRIGNAHRIAGTPW